MCSRTFNLHFVWLVRTRGATSESHVANDFAAVEPCAGNSRKRRKVGVPGGDSKTMVDNHQPTVARMVLCDSDNPIRSRVNRSPIIRSHIHSGVERAFAAERIQALAEAIGDVAH